MNCGNCARGVVGLLPSITLTTKGVCNGSVYVTRNITSTGSGSVLPMPHKTRFGLLGVACTVIPGLLIGATISKKMANFLEENELFVPSDDDDDDD